MLQAPLLDKHRRTEEDRNGPRFVANEGCDIQKYKHKFQIKNKKKFQMKIYTQMSNQI